MEVSTVPKEKNATHRDQFCRNTERVMSKLLGEKEAEWAAVVRSGPLNLLDLPVDILKEIIRQVSTLP